MAALNFVVERFGDAGKYVDSFLYFQNGEVNTLKTYEILEINVHRKLRRSPNGPSRT